MITQILIKHVDTDVLLFNKECSSVRECVEAAIKAGADLSGAYLSGADLSGAYLSGANLVRANLARADLSGAYLARADLVRANLARADLSGAYLSGADLSGAYLSGADLVRANLARADLSGAYLSGANLARADLSCADFRDIDLIDGGQSICGHRFWCWRDSHGAIVYRAGCHEWRSFDEAVDYYGESYAGDGSRQEGIARLTLMYDAAFRRWQS